ncbi:KRI1 family protein [Rhodotorula paludigena]|uniref:KRI1 family protein n=1 Tax=Rhodotorula paludigena TaxID=86838 RepID=UPI003174C51A
MAPTHALVDSSDSDSDSDAASASLSAFKVNDAFAQKYDAKKRTEELSKLQDKYGKDYQLPDDDDDDDDETDYSTDDEDAELVTPEVDAAILRTLAKIRAKDPSVYEHGREVFDEEEAHTKASRPSSSSRATAKASSSKPVLLKDYQRARLLANPEDDASLDAGDAAPLTHAEEQRALKREITAAFHAGSDDEDDAAAEEDNGDEDSDDDAGGLFKRREKGDDERVREEQEYEKFLETAVGKKAVKEALAEEDAFLRNYILNRGWIDRENDTSHVPSYDEIVGDAEPSSSKKKGKSRLLAADEGDDDGKAGDKLDPGAHDEDDDDEFEDRAEEFEHRYNFRFEETGAADIVTHARDAASSVRKPTTAVSARARAREAAKERKEAEKLQRKEELRRLKALKRKEVEDRLEQLLEAAGKGTQGLEEIDLEGEWDEAKHEEAMRKVYGDEYEGLEDDDFKPTWDDDIDITDIVGPEDASDDDEGAAPVASTSALPMDVDEEAEEEEASPKKSKKDKKKERKEKKAKRDEEGLPTDLLETVKASGDAEQAQLVDRLVDEYYGLDYEDQVGDLKTRFRYAKVAPSSFNLTAEEILLATDAELNAFMSLKKLAPYRQDSAAWQAKQQQKQRKKLKELRDTLRQRKWGEEVDEAAAQRALDKRRDKKRRYRENAEKRKADALEAGGADEGGSGGADAAAGDGEPPKKKKRAGKSERKRLQAQKATEEAA